MSVLQRWEMRKTVCERKKREREMSASGGIALWDTGDLSPADIHNAQAKKQQAVLKHTFIDQLQIFNTLPLQDWSYMKQTTVSRQRFCEILLLLRFV